MLLHRITPLGPRPLSWLHKSQRDKNHLVVEVYAPCYSLPICDLPRIWLGIKIPIQLLVQRYGYVQLGPLGQCDLQSKSIFVCHSKRCYAECPIISEVIDIISKREIRPNASRCFKKCSIVQLKANISINPQKV